MCTQPSARIKAWWIRYRTWVIVLLVGYLVFILVLILLTADAEREPFRYQISFVSLGPSKRSGHPAPRKTRER